MLIIFDQITKYHATIKPEFSRLVIINDGVIFGIYGANNFIMGLLIILSVAVIIVAYFFYRFYIVKCRQSLLMDIFVISFCSSTISNTIDRIIFGGGRDFINALGQLYELC
ncbi:signal peptidase II [Desulfolucanica intricata]|uniref:signal peptidase II n=1 Tax=Desulfolucanica intricata TaxID=1285191 RepID=UPI00350E3380